MDWFSKTYFIFIVVISTDLIYAATNDCKCVQLANCQPYLRLLRFNNTPKTREEIVSRICESTDSQMMVCCPNNEFASDNYFPVKCGRSKFGNKIRGGLKTTIGEYPWIAGLGYRAVVYPNLISYRCAGSIINSRYIVTAAHCIHSNFSAGSTLTTVRLGEWSFSSAEDCLPPSRISRKRCAPPPIDLSIEEYVLHPNFNLKSFLSDDIAVIRLNQTIDFDESRGYIEPVCSPSLGLNAEFEADGDLIAAGWGLTENNTFSDDMLKVYLPFSDVEECRRLYGSRYTNTQLCVGGVNGKDTCMGDSGGPLMLTQSSGISMAVGIVSYGDSSCSGRHPAVYTSISDYRDWIEDSMMPW